MQKGMVRKIFSGVAVGALTLAAIAPFKDAAVKVLNQDCESVSLTEKDVKLCENASENIAKGSIGLTALAAGAGAAMLAGRIGRKQKVQTVVQPPRNTRRV